MNTYSIKSILLVFLFFSYYGVGFSQSNFETLGETTFAVNFNVNKSYIMNFDIRSRYYFYKNDQIFFNQRQLDIIHFSTFNLNYNQNISLGIQYRNRDLFENFSNEIRVIEQFNFKNNKIGFRIGHRFRTEQRYLLSSTIFRQRYRLTFDIPLNGEKLNIGETFLVTSIETLLSINKLSKPEYDYRTCLLLGWQVSKDFIFQGGIEYRLEAFNINTEHKLFLLTTGILKL